MKNKNQAQQRNLIIVLAVLLSVILISFVMASFGAFSKDETQEVVETLIAENEDNPESAKYLVTDNCISRVYPGTDVKTFTTNFSEGETVKVYSDENCTQEITEGLVKSGMYAKYEANSRVFEISVLGDINEKTAKDGETATLQGDGQLNQIELTRDIREAVADQKWITTDESEKKSADVNCNNNVDQAAVKTIINYIVFGDLNIPEVENVEKPLIEVIKGNLNKNTIYTSDVTLKIAADDACIDKIIYKINGDKEQSYKTALDNEEIVLNENGIYKITAYAYGKLGNKSKREYAIINIDKMANYKMEYYLENVDGTFTKIENDTKIVKDEIGKDVEIEEKQYTDYELDVDNPNGKLTGTVLEDGTLLLKAYYTRKNFTYTFVSGVNVESVSAKLKETSSTSEENSENVTNTNYSTEVSITAKWGKTIEINAKLAEIPGYTIMWKNWAETENTTSSNATSEAIAEQKATLTIGKANKTYEATGTKEAIDYKINYDLGGGNLASGVTNVTKYNIETPAFTLNNPSKAGYTFKGWTGGVVDEDGNLIANATEAQAGNTLNTATATNSLTINAGSMGSRKYIANWETIKNTSYKVEHYKETLETGVFELAETENKGGETDTTATATAKEYTGFSFDEDNENNVISGTITADGKLVLKLYYTRKTYNLTIKAGENISKVYANGVQQSATATLNYKYEQEITLNADKKTITGYEVEWSKWSSNNEQLIADQTSKELAITMPAGNVTLTAEATKTATIYNITYNLNGGTLPENVTNPSTYTIESPNITLNNLQDGTRLGYNFAGWTGSNGTTPSKNVVLASGSTGDKTYTANWVEADFKYTVEYYYDNVLDASKTEANNTAKYNSQVSTYTDKCITGYELKEEPTAITISNNEVQNVLKVYYVRKSYTVTLTKDANVLTVDGAGTYKFNEKVQIDATLAEELGYTITWNKWASQNTATMSDVASKTATITIPAGNVELKATANKVANTYSIEYMLNGGTVASQNPTSYTIETPTFTLNNPSKQGYVFAGWVGGTQETQTGATGNVTDPTPTLTIEQGSVGDRVYTAKWEGDSETAYTVEHYQENLDGTFELKDTVQKTGTTDTEVVAEKKSYTGFSYDENNENNVLTGIVKADGTLVLKVYYVRNEYTLGLVAGSNVTNVSMTRQDGKAITTETTLSGTNLSATFKYGTFINITSTLKEETGHTIEWSKWESSDSQIIAGQTDKDTTIAMPVGDVTLTATATNTTNSYGYKIEYYYDGTINASNTVTKETKYGTTISSYQDKNITGYELEKTENNPLTVTENEATNVMKIYYKAITYSINYNLAGGELAENETNPDTYTVNSNTFTLNVPTKVGYTFTGWTGSNGTTETPTITIEKGSVGNREYTANWRANTDTEYQVEHYIEKVDSTEASTDAPNESNYTLYQTDGEDGSLYGTTGETATGTPIAITGFTYSQSKSANTISAEIKADGTTVLKIYYTRNSYSLTLNAGSNIASVQVTSPAELSNPTEITANYKYAQTININATLKTEENYTITWDKWESSTAEFININTQNAEITMPAKDVSLTATANKAGNPVNYTVEYYYDNEIDSTKTVTKTAKYADVIDNYTDKNITGYELEKIENKPLTLTANADENVMKVYYKEITYSINYNLAGGELAENEANPETYTVNSNTFTLNNPTKVGYDFIGWTGSNGTTEASTVTIEKGSTGNRQYTANWRASTDTKYKVEHYIENVESTEASTDAPQASNYTLYQTDGEDGNLYGTTGETATGAPIEITGFTYSQSKSANTISAEIKADGTTVLKIYYTRNSYNLTLIKGENIAKITNGTTSSSNNETQVTVSYKYQQEVSITVTLKAITGYNVSFTNWTSSNTVLVANQTQADPTINMPAGDVTLTANATANKANFVYTVEYYYDGEKDEEATVTGAPTEFETQVIAYDDKVKTGYEFEKTENLPLTISADVTENVIKVYYKLKTYNITYNLDGGELEQNVTNPETYNIKSADIELNAPEKEGYLFNGWIGGVVDDNGNIIENATEEQTGATPNTTTKTKALTILQGSIGNRKYTATWIEREYEVDVHHYLENTGAEYGVAAVEVAEDEILASTQLGSAYTTNDLIPDVDEEGNITEEDANKRAYLDPTEFYLVSNSANTTGKYAKEKINVYYYYQYYPAIRITASPVEDLVGTEYVTIADCLQAMEDAGLTEESEVTKILVLRNIKNESSEIEDKNIEIDLNSFTINSNSGSNNAEEAEPTIKLTESTLTIVDNSTKQTGKVSSENDVAVYVDINSTFTLGENVTPINQTPQIIGNTKGIEIEKDETQAKITDEATETEYYPQGTFKFFDGKVIGNTAIDGFVNETPYVYSATVTTNSDSKQVSTLAIVSGREARIGRKLYTTLEKAIEDAQTVYGTDGSQVEIVLVADISKSARVVVDSTKNIKLDIAGHVFTTTASDYVLENKGKLEIVDSSETIDEETGEAIAGTGKITSTTSSVILNSETDGTKGELTLSSGKLTLASSGTYSAYKNVITNYGNLTLDGAQISSSSSYNNGICSYSTAKNTILSGSISGTCDAIKQNGTSTLEMSGGTISAYIGITNNSTAEVAINITGGSIAGTSRYALRNNSNTEISIKNATLSGQGTSNDDDSYTLNNYYNTGKIYVENSTINAKSYAVRSSESKFSSEPNYYSIEIVNSTITSGNIALNSSNYAFSSKQPCKIKISGGSVTGAIRNVGSEYDASTGNKVELINITQLNSAITNQNKSMDIINCNLTGSVSSSSKSDTINIQGGTISGNVTNSVGTLNISGGTAITTSSATAIRNSATANILDATITSTSSSNWAVNNTGTLTFGNKEDEVNQTTPEVNAPLGVYNSTGTFNFYDGIINSNVNNSIRGSVADVPDGYQLIINVDDTTETATIGIPTDYVAQIGENKYTSLEAAITAVPDNAEQATTIELLKTLNPAKTYTIPDTKNIKLALNGNNINGYIKNGYIFNNEGTFEITAEKDAELPELKLTDRVNIGSYGFDIDSTGRLVSNNTGINSSTANCYIPIDLSNNSMDVTLSVNAQISSQPNDDYGYATVVEKTSEEIVAPAHTAETGRFIHIANTNNSPSTYTYTLSAGKQYYLYFGYNKNASYTAGNDQFIINNISLSYSNAEIKTYSQASIINNSNKLTVDEISLKLYASGTSSNYISAINNSGECIINGTAMETSTYDYIKLVNNEESGSVTVNKNARMVSHGGSSSANYNHTYGLYSNSSGNIIINSSYINTNKLISNNGTGNVTINGGFYQPFYYVSDNYAIYNANSSAIITINKAYISLIQYQLFANINNGKLVMNGGYVLDSGHNELYGTIIELYNSSEFEMNGGTISTYDDVHLYSANAKMKMTNGTISSLYSAVNNAGTVEISGGTMSVTNGNCIESTGTVKVSQADENVPTKITGTTSGILNKGTAEIYGGTIQGSTYGINNSGTATITGGTIKATNGIGITSSKTLTLGQEGGVPSKTNPSVYGKTYGVSVGSSTFNFYDGIIEGASAQSISGTVSAQQDGYDVIKTTADSRETAVLDMLPVAKIVSTGTEYYSLAEAIEACADNTAEEVQILRNIIINSSAESIEIASSKEITLNTAGYEVSAGNENTFIVKGKLTLIDEPEESETTSSGLLQNTANNFIQIEDEGQLIINSGTLKNTVAKSLIVNKGIGRAQTTEGVTERVGLIINGGTLSYTTGTAINNYGKETTTEETNELLETETVTTLTPAGNVKINGGSIVSTSNGTGISVTSGIVELNNATITTSGYAVYVAGEGANVKINGGTYATSGYGVYNNSASENVYVYSGTYGVITNNSTGNIFIGSTDENITVPTTSRVYNNSTGQIQIDNATINCQYNGCISNTGNGTITINGGTFSGSGSSNGYDIGATVYNRYGTVNINGGEFYNSYRYCGVVLNGYRYESKKATVNITGGKFTESCSVYEAYATIMNQSPSGTINITGGEITNTSGHAIYNYSGTINLGSNDGTIDNDSLKITAKSNYAVVNSSGAYDVSACKLNYYDGTIEGPLNKSIYGSIEQIEEGAEIVYTKDSTEVAKLTKASDIAVAYIGETPYYTLSSAFADCGAAQTTIKLNQDIGLGSIINISASQNIILDLNSHRINEYSKFVNNGTFEITDSSTNASGIIDTSVRLVDNTGSFKLSNGQIYSYVFRELGNSYSTAKLTNRIIINNTDEGNVDLDGGNIYYNHHAVCIWDESTCDAFYIHSSSTGRIRIGNTNIQLNGWYPDSYSRIFLVRTTNSNTENLSNVVIDGATITGNGSGYISAIYPNRYTNVEINSGTITGCDYIVYSNYLGSRSDYGINNLTINGGNLSGSISIYNSYVNTLSINGGSIAGSIIINDNIAETSITGGTITGNLTMHGTTTNINGGTVTGTLTMYGNNVNLNGGTFNQVTINGSGKTNIDNTNINGTNNLAIKNLTVSGANTTTIRNTDINGLLTVNHASAKVTMVSGSITNTSGNAVNVTNGTFTLGVIDYPVSTTAPAITSSAIGVNVTGGTFNFYDGIIKGDTQAINGVVAKTPELYTVQLTGGETEATLGINATFEQVAIMNGTYYDSVQEAINAAGNTNAVIKLQKDSLITTGIVISSTQNITIDLAGYSINATDIAYTITNNGTLTIKDTVLTDNSSTVYSKIENYTGTAIYNAGTLILGVDDKEIDENTAEETPIVYSTVPTIKGAIYGIENNANTASLSIFDGTIKAVTNALATAPTTIMVPSGYELVSAEETDGETTYKILTLR